MRGLAVRMNLLIVLCLLVACGASQREKTIKATLVAVNASRAAFGELDLTRQRAILSACNPPTCFEADYNKQIAAYRATRESIVKAFEDAYRTIANALALYDDQKSLQAVIDVASKLEELIVSVKTGAPP